MREALAILEKAARTIASRNETHGDIAPMMARAAALWTAYLSIRKDPHSALAPEEVCEMMALFKQARRQSGRDNPDDDLDFIGYGALIGEIRAQKRAKR